MDSAIDGESDCVGSLKLVTTDRTHIVRISESRLNIKNVKQVVVEGSCCGSIYFKKNFRVRSTSWDRAGLIKSSLWRVKSVRLRMHWLKERKDENEKKNSKFVRKEREHIS